VRRLTDDQLWDMTELQVVRAIRAGDAHTDDLRRWRELDDVADEVDDLFSPGPGREPVSPDPVREPVEDDILDDGTEVSAGLSNAAKLSVAVASIVVLGLLGYSLGSR
jgi:hypothetical protein